MFITPLADSTRINLRRSLIYSATLPVVTVTPPTESSLSVSTEPTANSTPCSTKVLELKSKATSTTELRLQHTITTISEISDIVANTTEIATTTSNMTVTKDKKNLTKTIRKSVAGSSSIKPIVRQKSIVARKSLSVLKPVGNCQTVQGVEKVLKQINMIKYKQMFKNMELEKFKRLREIDLNAMGITRPSEIRILKEAILKAKSEK